MLFTHRFRLRKDGWLLYPFRDSKGNEIPVKNKILNYCVDGAQSYGELTDYLNAEEQTVLFLCSGGVDEGKKIKKRKRKKAKKSSSTTHIPPIIMRTQFANTPTLYNSSRGVEVDSKLSTKLLQKLNIRLDTTLAPTTTAIKTNSVALMTLPIKEISATNSSTSSITTTAAIVPMSYSFPPRTPTSLPFYTTSMTMATSSDSTTTSSSTTTSAPPTIRTQERKVFTLFSSSRNKHFYNKIMSGNNNASSNQISISNDPSSSSSTTVSSLTTKKSRFRKRSRHYIFYKPISVHSLLRSNNGDYYYT